MSSTSGFTLVELMIVMVIGAMLTALVGGLSVDNYRKYQLKGEELELISFLKQSSNKAFLYEQSLTVNTTDNQIILSKPDKKSVSNIQFAYLTLDSGTFSINRYGTFSQQNVTFYLNGRAKTLDLLAL